MEMIWSGFGLGSYILSNFDCFPFASFNFWLGFELGFVWICFLRLICLTLHEFKKCIFSQVGVTGVTCIETVEILSVSRVKTVSVYVPLYPLYFNSILWLIIIDKQQQTFLNFKGSHSCRIMLFKYCSWATHGWLLSLLFVTFNIMDILSYICMSVHI